MIAFRSTLVPHFAPRGAPGMRGVQLAVETRLYVSCGDTEPRAPTQ
jgi:hypothetical protein